MKIYLDLATCPTWMGACESCFGWYLNHLMENEFLPSTCTISWDDGCREEITFFVRDKDGKDRVLIVNQENWAEAYDSWSQLLTEQEEAGV